MLTSLLWVLLCIVVCFIIVTVYACCVMAGRADRAMEEELLNKCRKQKPPDESTRYHWF